MIDVLVWIIVLLPPFDWLVALILTGLSRSHPEILVLRERAFGSVMTAIVASGAGVLGWAFFGFIKLPPGSGVVILAMILILASVPSLYWLLLLLLGRWKLDGEA